jgi:hypothetical protein
MIDYMFFDNIFNNNFNNDEINYIEKNIIDFINNYSQYIHDTITGTNILLDINNINKENGTIIEKFIYNNSLQSITEYNKKYNTNYNIDDFDIEFWGNTSPAFHGLHYDINENYIDTTQSYFNPAKFTTITFFTDSNISPLFITDIERPRLKNNLGDWKKHININTQSNNETIMVFPKKYNQILFEGSKYLHGVIQLENYKTENRYVIACLFYLKNKEHPLNYPYFSSYSYYNWCLNNNKKFCINNSIFKKIDYLKNIFIYLRKNNNKKGFTINIVDNIDFYNRWYYNLTQTTDEIDFSFIKKHIYNELNYYKDTRLFNIFFIKNI